MAVKIPNLIQRNGIYYFRCRIPSNLTDGQYREVKVSLKTRTFDSLLFESVRRASDYLQIGITDIRSLIKMQCAFLFAASAFVE